MGGDRFNSVHTKSLSVSIGTKQPADSRQQTADHPNLLEVLLWLIAVDVS